MCVCACEWRSGNVSMLEISNTRDNPHRIEENKMFQKHKQTKLHYLFKLYTLDIYVF